VRVKGKAEERLRRQSAQQEVLANLSSAALSGRTIVEVATEAVEMIAQVLDVRGANIWRAQESGGIALAASFGEPRFTGEVIESLVAANHSSVREGSAVFMIGGGGGAVGALAVSSFGRLRSDEIHFLSAVANLLAQAIDRERAVDELRTRAAQQVAIAQFGRFALLGITPELMQHLCEVVQENLGVDYAAFLAFDRDANQFRLSAGSSWISNDTPIAADESTLSGYTALHGGPVIVEDYATESRFETRERFVDHGIVSGMAAEMRGEHNLYGILTAQSRTRRRFGDTDARFLQSLANASAEAMERDAAQRALVDSEARYRDVIEGSSDIIYTLDAAGRVIALNSAFERVTGWPAAEWLGRDFIDMVVPADRDHAEGLFDAAFAGETTLGNLHIATPAGGEVAIETTARAVMKDGVVTAIHAFSRDITLRERLEHQLEQANRLTSLGRLAATIAHEFNNVLMGISPFVELLKRGDIAYDRRLSALDHMAKSVQRGRRITEEIFRFTNPVEPVFEAVPLAQWSQSVVHELRPLLGNQYTFNVELQKPGLRALADIGQLHQIVSNLVINARDAMPEGGRITLRICREPSDAQFDFGVVAEPETLIHLIVEDEGGGMSPETKHHIFEPLFTTKRNGTGLGLAITHQAVQRHGGMIFVESEIGKGARFHIFLRAADHDLPKRRPDAQPASAKAHRRILLVEDDPSVSTGIALLLQEEDFIVDVVNLGAEALEAVFRTQPDVVVLDIGLPDIDGTKVYEDIAASYPNLAVVFSTGHGDARKLEPYLARGNVAMLLKPYDIEKLIAAIDRLTAGRA
jgi:PAS domain S-box-containing protein